MVGQRRRAAVYMILASLLLILLVSVSASAGQPVVMEIAFEGNKRLDDGTLLQYVTHTKVGEPVSEEAIEADRKALFESGYFWSIEPAKLTSVFGGVRVVFSVVENPVVTGVTIKNDVLPVDELAAYMKTQPGKVLNINELREDLNSILPERAVEEFGILIRVADASVSPENGQVNIVLEEKRISQIRVEGNAKTKDHVILRELKLAPGDVLNLEQLNKGLHRVLMLGYFDEVSRKIEPGENPDDVILTVKVKERKTAVFTGGVGYSSNEGFIGYVDLADENFLGKGQRVNFRWEFGKTKNSYDIGFYEPYLDENGTSIGFNVYNKNRQLVDTDTGESYDKRSLGGDVTLGRPLSEVTRGYLTTRVERVTELRTSGEETFNTRSIRLATVTNTSNHPFFPTEGHKLQLSAEAAGYLLGGDSKFIKYEADYSKYLKVGSNNQSLAFRISGGLLTGEEDRIPDYEKFRVGGAESVRGYDYGDFTGSRKLVLNSEYRFQIKDAFHGVLFVDAGNAWNAEESMELNDLNVGYGAGLRIDTPLGVMRFDYGWGDGGGNFYFSLGQMF